MDRLKIIKDCLSKYDNIVIIEGFTINDVSIITGKIGVIYDRDQNPLEFEVVIYPYYPYKIGGTDSIRFINNTLIDYNHIMEGGFICTHSSHNKDIRKKFNSDLRSLLVWIDRYYVNKENDAHYEHLIIPKCPIENIGYHSFFFTDIDHKFAKDEYGYIEYTDLFQGRYEKSTSLNYVVRHFFRENSEFIESNKWSLSFETLIDNRKIKTGYFFFLGEAPSNGKFIIKKWSELNTKFSRNFLKFLYQENKLSGGNIQKNELVPLFIGYNIPDDKIHWQAAILKAGQFPLISVKQDKVWHGIFSDEKINWAITDNCSYDNFFGKGKLTNELIKGKILILGVGAIGSIVAKTLVRGGARTIELNDYDVKNPDNVCRSEYSFITGNSNKTDDLSRELTFISPFVDVYISDSELWNGTLKLYALKTKDSKKELEEILSAYDLIFDCSTDNDLMYIFNEMGLSNVINISITNKARALVCGVETNSYNWVINQFSGILENDTTDLYNPTGCWSPTFKASYNDINTLVQHAIHQINLKLSIGKPLRNFILEVSDTDNFNINLKEF